MLKKIALQLIIALLIILWIYTGLTKAMDYEETKIQMARSPFIEGFASFLSIAVPAGELLLASLLIFKKTRMIGLYASIFTLVLFTGYIYLMLNYSFDLPCSCGGVLQALSWEDHLLFNAAYSVLAIIGAIIQGNLSNSKNAEITKVHATR